MDYTQLTEDQRRVMLDTIGVQEVDDLFCAIPEEKRLSEDLPLPPAMSELELQREAVRMAAMNRGTDAQACFLGAGAYDHFIPALIDQLISRGEYLTAYTPYQAEASQGALQAFFEFQTQIARLTGMEIANASLYEGATAVAEAIHLALSQTRKKRVLVAETVNPDYRRVVRTYLADQPAEYIEIPADKKGGTVSAEGVEKLLDADTACVVVQSPNFFGLIEDWESIFSKTHENGKTLAIAVFNPIACALLKRPGECGADMAAGEGQPLGIPLQFGGPYLGLFAATGKLMRKMPGRLIGQTTDTQGRRAYCLTLQTREQHIRHEKATSNVCTNQGLLALRATMYMTTMGAAGLRNVAEQCWHKAHYLAAEIKALPGYSLPYDKPFFNEFMVRCPVPAADLIASGKQRGLLVGVDMSSARSGESGSVNDLLIAVTEKRTRAEMDALVELFRERGQD
ncbi:MAG TPA: aminomethyl-transferring glycine dehydrogenase subunit GcvPA [Phycisphaeraceae bacterium]|nr:aminomethyl-transferring glycine dehydrogenase subunit GcvPA [Phycisphaeraceae bacterium]